MQKMAVYLSAIMSCRLVLVSIAALSLVAMATSCTSDLDCQLNGECNTAAGTCSCDKGWTGDDCGTLNLNTTAHVMYGYTPTSNTSCWGGGPPTYDESTGKYGMLVTEMAGHCGMSTWGRMSQSVLAVADSVEGPYTHEKVVVGTESHNTIYAYSEVDKTHLMYTIFEGISPPSCNPYLNCTDGTTTGGKGLHPPSHWPAMHCPNNNNKGGRGVVHWAKSLSGPWTSIGPVRVDWGPNGEPPNSGLSNPAPYIFPNGTVLLLGRGQDAHTLPNGTRIKGHNVWLFRAETWNSTYKWIPLNGLNGSLPVGANSNKGPLTEDPVLYRGRRGFHILFHSSPDLTHAWSLDGFDWKYSPQVMGPPTHASQGGGDNERPRVVLDDNGDIEYVMVSQLVPAAPGADGADASRLAAFRALS
eukprot:m.60168 g.60168  ORF g.60168 m.60168 type:complete len:414 (+) comp13840_c0_seq3:275-1516(+)